MEPPKINIRSTYDFPKYIQIWVKRLATRTAVGMLGAAATIRAVMEDVEGPEDTLRGQTRKLATSVWKSVFGEDLTLPVPSPFTGADVQFLEQALGYYERGAAELARNRQWELGAAYEEIKRRTLDPNTRAKVARLFKQLVIAAYDHEFTWRGKEIPEELEQEVDYVIRGDVQEKQIELKRQKSRSIQTHCCAHCNSPMEELRVCGWCERVAYCGSQCQAGDWPVHSRECGK